MHQKTKPKRWRVFISYSRRDIKRARTIREFLEQSFPRVEFWMDEQQLPVGEDFRRTIQAAIEDSEVFLVLCSLKALASPEVRSEIEIALNVQQQRLRKGQREFRIIPLRIDKTCTDRDLQTLLPEAARPLSWLDATSPVAFENAVRLMKEIRRSYTETMLGDCEVLQTLRELVQSVTDQATSTLRLLLVDGGVTLRTLLERESFGKLLDHCKGNVLDVRFIYVDTACKESVATSVAALSGSASAQFQDASQNLVKCVFEGLLQSSRWIHNHGPHDRDVQDMLQELKSWKQGVGNVVNIDIRSVPLIPLHRLILTDSFAHVTHFFPLEDGLDIPKLDYYSLKLRSTSGIYEVASVYFEKLWERARQVRL